MKILLHNFESEKDKFFREIKPDFSEFIKVTVFFDNANFLITDYTPLTSSVHMILEDSLHNELHIENCNCGYGGTGPHSTVSVLQAIGLTNDINEIRNLIFCNDALQFEIQNNKIVYSSINTSLCFHATIRSYSSKIPLDGNVYTDITKRKVIFINPQYHYFFGFLNYIKKINVSRFEYYIGENSPLGNYLNIDSLKNSNFNSKVPDLQGVVHTNLVLGNENTEICCLIDRNNEIEVINAIYLALNNNNLFSSEEYDINVKPRNFLKRLYEEIFPKRAYYNSGKVIHKIEHINLENKK